MKSNDPYDLLEHLLSHPDFARWAQGGAPEMDAYWEQWAGEHPMRKAVLLQAKNIILSLNEPLPEVSDEYIYQRVREAVKTASERESAESGSHTLSFRRWRVPALSAAACILIIFTAFWAFRKTSFSGPVSLSETVVASAPTENLIKNTANAPFHLQLPDGSSVVLKPGSSLRFPEQFSDEKREVELIGEAFFEVVKNPKSPFFIRANQTLTRVVGTSFRLKAKPNTAFLEVNVKSGVVAVYRRVLQSGQLSDQIANGPLILLEKDQKMRFEIKGEVLSQQIELTEFPARLPIEEISFTYEGTPLSEVFSDLELAYGVKINYDADKLSGCSLTAELGDEPLATKLKWIATIMEAESSIENNEVFFTGNSCH